MGRNFKLKARTLGEKEQIVTNEEGQKFLVRPRQRKKLKEGRDFVYLSGFVTE